MKRLLLLMFLALMAIPTFAQTTAAPTAPHRAPIRDPFARPTAETLKRMESEPAPQVQAPVEVESDSAVATYPEDTTAPTQTQSYAVMEEPASTAGDTTMWVLGGIAALGLIGALAYVILGMGSDDRTVYTT